MQINAINDTNDPSFLADEQTAINILDSTFTDNISVTIQIGFGDFKGTTLRDQSISEGDVNSNLCVAENYQTLRANLLANQQQGFFNGTNLPAGASINGVSNFYISSSVAACFGIFEPGTDGFVGIGTGFTPGAQRVSAFLHEICHALGRVPETIGGNASELDLWRFTSVGNRLFSGTNPDQTFSYFSLDGGQTEIAQWGQTSDSSDFRNGFPFTNDPFNESVGNLGQLTTADIEVMQALGFRTGPLVPVPAGTSAFMIMHDGGGNYDIFDLGQNSTLVATGFTQINTSLRVVGLGDFNGTDNADMLMRDGSTGAFELHDVRDNAVTAVVPMGQSGLEWSVAGFGDFSGNANESDMMMRNSNSGQLDVFDINSNQFTNFVSIGQVGLEWSVAGFGDFSGNPNETDLLIRNNNGVLAIFDINHNQIYGQFGNIGQVGLEWSVAGFGNLSGNANETDMLMRDTTTGQLRIFDISNNQFTGSFSIGQIGSEWTVDGVTNASNGAHGLMAQAMAGFSPTSGAPLAEVRDQITATTAGSSGNQLIAPSHLA